MIKFIKSNKIKILGFLIGIFLYLFRVVSLGHVSFFNMSDGIPMYLLARLPFASIKCLIFGGLGILISWIFEIILKRRYNK